MTYCFFPLLPRVEIPLTTALKLSSCRLIVLESAELLHVLPKLARVKGTWHIIQFGH